MRLDIISMKKGPPYLLNESNLLGADATHNFLCATFGTLLLLRLCLAGTCIQKEKGRVSPNKTNKCFRVLFKYFFDKPY